MNRIILFSIVSFTIGVPILLFLSKKLPTLSSPYAKADFSRRMLAVIIDGMVCIALLYIGISNRDHLIVSLIGTALYILLKDGLLKGISIGKFFAGIRVIRLRDGYSAEIPDSILRNFIFIIPGLSLAGIVIEIILLYKDKQGIRVGDKIAHTQVVIGKSCYEYIKDFVFYADDRSRSHDKIA